MRRLAVALFVIGFVAAGCTPTNPPTSTSSTTASTTTSTAPVQGLREAFVDGRIAYNTGIDSANYPANATIEAYGITNGGRCEVVGILAENVTDVNAMPGSELCDAFFHPLRAIFRSQPVPLAPGRVFYMAGGRDSEANEFRWSEFEVFRISW